jgi:hypothetical protein
MKLRTDQKHGTKFEMAQTTQTQPEMETERVENKPQAAAQAVISGWREYVNAFLAAEVSALTRYYDRVIQWLPREDDKVPSSQRSPRRAKKRLAKTSRSPT